MHSWRSTPAHRLIVSGICGIVGVLAASTLSAADKFDGNYSGKRTLLKGDAAMCPAEENVSVTIHDETLTFTNSALKKFTISFDPKHDGSFGETYTAEGGDAVKIDGHVIGGVIEADVINYGTDPPCEHHWHLQKQ